MVGVGKLLNQAQKMQKKMEEALEALAQEDFEVSGGGGAVAAYSLRSGCGGFAPGMRRQRTYFAVPSTYSSVRSP